LVLEDDLAVAWPLGGSTSRTSLKKHAAASHLPKLGL